MPFRTPGGPVLIAAEPVRDDGPHAGGRGAGARAGVGRRDPDPDLTGTRWRLLWSGLTGPWREFALLTVGADAGRTVDRGTRFHPVRATPPGMPSYAWARAVRAPAYGAAQLLGRPRPPR
jgi:hypothetical protein